MKFDSRNPFAAWGFEQEVYTKTSGNDPEKTGMNTMEAKDQGYQSRLTADAYYANNGEAVEMSDAKKAEWTEAHKTVESIFSNNENMIPTAYLTKAYAVDAENNKSIDIDYKTSEKGKKDADLYNNTELNYYGIQYADLYTVGDSQSEIVPVVAE